MQLMVLTLSFADEESKPTFVGSRRWAFGLLAALLLWCSTALGGVPAMTISIQMAVDGRLVASPSLSIQNGKTAVIGIGDEWELEVAATAGARAADVRLRLSAHVDGRLTLVGSPQVLAPYDELSTAQWRSDAGRTYLLMVTPTRVKAKGRR
jgi:hypothetical protein